MNRPDDELAGKIIGHLRYGVEHLDPALRERLAGAGRETVAARFDGDRLAGRLAELFRAALA